MLLYESSGLTLRSEDQDRIASRRQSPSSERDPRPWAHYDTRRRILRVPEGNTTDNVEGIEKDLGSGMICGIGPIYARKLVRTFGEAVFDLIEQALQRLHEVTGVG